MKRILVTTAAVFGLSSAAALAGGLAPPIIEAVAVAPALASACPPVQSAVLGLQSQGYSSITVRLASDSARIDAVAPDGVTREIAVRCEEGSLTRLPLLQRPPTSAGSRTPPAPFGDDDRRVPGLPGTVAPTPVLDGGNSDTPSNENTWADQGAPSAGAGGEASQGTPVVGSPSQTPTEGPGDVTGPGTPDQTPGGGAGTGTPAVGPTDGTPTGAPGGTPTDTPTEGSGGGTPVEDTDKTYRPNNGWGNGDQTAPGESGPNNNAENAEPGSTTGQKPGKP